MWCQVSRVGAVSPALPVGSDRGGRIVGVAPQQILAQVAQIVVGNVASNRCLGGRPVLRASEGRRLGAPRRRASALQPGAPGVLRRRRSGAQVGVGGLRVRAWRGSGGRQQSAAATAGLLPVAPCVLGRGSRGWRESAAGALLPVAPGVSGRRGRRPRQTPWGLRVRGSRSVGGRGLGLGRLLRRWTPGRLRVRKLRGRLSCRLGVVRRAWRRRLLSRLRVWPNCWTLANAAALLTCRILSLCLA